MDHLSVPNVAAWIHFHQQYSYHHIHHATYIVIFAVENQLHPENIDKKSVDVEKIPTVKKDSMVALKTINEIIICWMPDDIIYRV